MGASYGGAASGYDPGVRLLSTVLLLTLMGCDRYDLEGEVVEAPCDDQAILAFGPPADSVEGYVDGPVWVDLRCPTGVAGLAVTRSDGQTADGDFTSHHGQRQIRWVPSEPLTPQTQYLAHFESPEAGQDWSFTTNGVGAPIDSRLAGTGFAMYPADGAILDPPGLDDVLAPILDALHPVVAFRGEPGPSGTVLAVFGARASVDDASDQDLALRTWAPNATWTDPLFSLGPLRLDWTLDGAQLILENARVSGGISSDAAWGAGFSLSGWWDTRPIDASLNGPGSVCAAAEDAGVECTECADEAPSCLRFEVVLARATRWTGTLDDVP